MRATSQFAGTKTAAELSHETFVVDSTHDWLSALGLVQKMTKD